MTTLVTTCHKDSDWAGSAPEFATATFPVHAIPLSQAASESRATRLTTLVTSCHKDRSSS